MRMTVLLCFGFFVACSEREVKTDSHIQSAKPLDPLELASDSNTFEVGGSNYISWHLGPKGGTPTDGPEHAMDFKHVIYTYHQNPDIIRQQIQSMCDHGQKKISLMIWFAHAEWMASETWNNAYGTITNSKGGALSPQISQNLRNILSDLKVTTDPSGTACFNELFFRFAPWSVSTALSWGDQWNEAMYLENKQFIFSTRAIVEEVLQDSSVRRTYDLGAEEAGLTDAGQMKPYAKRLWEEYIGAFGDDDTYGFSMAVYKNRGWRLLEIFDQVGKRPKEYALDVYSIQHFEDVLDELKYYGEAHKPIVIQETFYNDANFVAELFRAAGKYGFKIRTIMQWPKAYNTGHTEYTEVFPQMHFNNKPVPFIARSGLGCEDRKCIWLQGTSFSNGCRIDIYNVYGGRLKDPTNISCMDNYATFRIPDDVYNANQRLNVTVVNQFNRWNAPVVVSIK